MFTLDRKLANGEELNEFDKLMLGIEIPSPPARNELVEGIVVSQTKGGYTVDIGRKADSSLSNKECSTDLEIGGTYTFLVFSDVDADEGPELSYDRAQNWLSLQQNAESGEVTMAKVYRIQEYRKGGVSGVKAVANDVRAFIPRSELAYRGRFEELLETEIPVKVLEANPTKGRFGSLILSHKQAVQVSQDEVLATLNAGDIVTGTVSKFIDPGVLVDLGGHVTGMIHKSEVSSDRSADPTSVVSLGEEVEVRVLYVNMDRRQVSLSMRSTGDCTYLESLEVGSLTEGTVSKIIGPGVLVDLDGKVTGLIHRTELTGNRNVDPKTVVEVGDKVPVKIIAVDTEKRTVSLSRRAAVQEPFLASLKEGEEVEGVVARFQDYGAFVTLGDCIDGLLHVSDLVKRSNLTETLKAGETIRVKVKSIDLVSSRIALTRIGLSNDDGSDGDKAA